MKNLALTIVFVLTSIFTFSQENAQNITVTIDNVKSDAGVVVFALHTENTFMKSEGIKNSKVKIEDGKATVTFKNVKAGTYAIMALHDENENNRMDFDANSMPKESYGMSNNSMSFGPPQYADAKFEVGNSDLDLKIRF